MPPRSEKQRRAMRSAAEGRSTIGIPKSVGQDFSEADPGGKLPESTRTSVSSEPKGLQSLMRGTRGPSPKGKHR